MSIYIIEDHPLMRDAIALVLRRMQPEQEIVKLDRLDHLFEAVKQHGAPDLLCLDLKLPDASGIQGVVSIRKDYPRVPLAVYSTSPAADMEEVCIEAGADIYIEKTAGSAELSASLQGLFQADEDSPLYKIPLGDDKLSKRQVQLVALLDRGLTNREIATELGVSEHTIKVHLWRLFRRLNVKNRTQAVHHARARGLVPNS
ncbi:MAG: response regulator transcription factor [Burkholderiaceae bacterium]|jgi:DNA-binding NarL/FixJ family response regulator|nr:response regulator transcription factor [Burkholderiaceae bacterium]